MQINSNIDGKYDCHDAEEHSTNNNAFKGNWNRLLNMLVFFILEIDQYL